MILQIGNTVADKATVDKVFVQKKEVNAIIKDNTSIINPTFIIETPNDLNINYCYCPAWNRYYYIKDIESMTGGRIALHCHVDVLMSNKEDIRRLTAIIEKQENTRYNKYLNDGSYITQSKVKTTTLEFANGFNDNGQYILICAGGEA